MQTIHTYTKDQRHFEVRETAPGKLAWVEVTAPVNLEPFTKALNPKVLKSLGLTMKQAALALASATGGGQKEKVLARAKLKDGQKFEINKDTNVGRLFHIEEDGTKVIDFKRNYDRIPKKRSF